MQQSFDDFDPFSSNYRNIHNENAKISGAESSYFSVFKVKWISDYVKNKKIKSILDLGCGDGTCLFYFRNMFPEADLFGLDVSEKSIEEAKTKNIVNCRTQTYNGSKIPFEDNMFDIILIATVLHHIQFKNHLEIILEANRVLNHNGLIFIFEHNPFNPGTLYMVNTCPFDKDAKLLKPLYLKKLLVSGGFKNVVNKYILFFPRWKIFELFLPIEPYFQNIPLGAQYVSIGRKSN